MNSRTTQSSELLRQVLEWADRQYSAFDLLVGDYLNRHNYIALDGLTEQEAMERTRRDGGDVAELLRALLADVGVGDTSIISAASLYAQPTFAGRLGRFENLFRTNREFAARIDEAVDAFLDRKDRRLASKPAVRLHCVAYQLEELAMFELLSESHYDALVYAGSQLPVMKAIVLKTLTDISLPLAMLSLVELRFFEHGTP